MTLSVLDNAVIQGLLYSGAVAGLILAFRLLRYPDLTADGSFLIGASMLVVATRAQIAWPIALLVAGLAGGACGCMTGFFHYSTRVNRLLSGVLSSMVCYSLAFRLLDSRPTVGLPSAPGPLSWASTLDASGPLAGSVHMATIALLVTMVGALIGLFVWLLQSDWGLTVRAAGRNPALVDGLGRRSNVYVVAGLACANLMIGISGAMVASHQQFVDVNMAIGLVVTLAAAMVFGEHLSRSVGLNTSGSVIALFVSGVIGTVAYYLLYLTVLRASVLGWLGVRFEPSDIKLISALVLAGGSWLSYRRSRYREDPLPL